MMTVDSLQTDFSPEWQVKQSKSHPGKVYYYNISTGESTWEPPTKVDHKTKRLLLKEKSKLTSRPKGSSQTLFTQASTMKQELQTFSTHQTIPRKGTSPLKRNGILTLCSFPSSLKPNKHSLSEKCPIASLLNSRCSPDPSLAVQSRRVILKAKRQQFVMPADLTSPFKVGKQLATKTSAEVASDDTSLSDIEMMDLEDLSSLEVHLQQDNAAASNIKAIHVVVDTNILLQELKLLNELKDLPLDALGPPYIIIPWVVIQELDSLKNKSKKQPGDNTFKKAACAVHFLYNLITKDHPRIRGQTAAEADESVGTLKAECNDDKILQCCLHLATKVPKENVLLLTNDKNLCSKACINHIKVFTKESFMEHFKSSFSKKQMSSRPSVLLESKESHLIAKPVLPKETAEIVDEVVSILLNVLSPLFEQEMKEAYGNIWVSMMKTKPPWSLKDILQGILKFWTAVFSFVFMKDSKNTIVELVQLLNQKGKNSKEVLQLIELGQMFCCQLRLRYSSLDDIDDSIRHLGSIRLNCLQGGTRTKRRSSSPRLEEEKKVRPALTEEENKIVLDQFQLVWDVINTLCGTILDVLNFPHSFKYCRPAVLPSQEEIIDFLAKFFPRLELLYRQMFKLVTYSYCPPPSLKGLCHSLTHLMPELGLTTSGNMSAVITPSLLEAFVTSLRNKELLWNGWVQLKQFYEVLHTCLRCKS